MPATRLPCSRLRPFVKLMWASEGAPARGLARREHVLPTGDMHLAFRLSGPPLRLFDGAGDAVGRTCGFAVAGGARSGHYEKDISVPCVSVGAQLRPGASWALLGVPASVLAEAHTPLDLLWGPAAAEALERLHAAATAAQRLDTLEALLLARLRAAHGLQPAVAHALQRLAAGASVGEAVAASGASHRHFIQLFREQTGLAPKTWGRLARFQAALRQLAAQPGLHAAALALDAGYSDQAHFQREFRAFAGLTPRDWRRAAPEHPNHVAVR